MKNDLAELRGSKSILRSLVMKELFGRYKNSALGFLWHFLTPAIMAIVYFVMFNEVGRSSIPDFWVYVLSALFPFNFMQSSLIGGASTIVGNAGLVKKMYFPREVIVYARVISAFIVMVIGYAAVFAVIVLSGFGLSPVALLTVIPTMLLMLVFVTGYTLLFSAATVYARDIQYMLSAISMVFYFMTPMYFIPGDMSGLAGAAIWANPFTYYVEALHGAVFFGEVPGLRVWAGCVLFAVVAFVLGLAVFKKLKGGFAERL